MFDVPLLQRLLGATPDGRLAAAAQAAWERCQPLWAAIEATAMANQARVLDAFQTERVAETDFAATTGYGYNDRGREKLEAVYARVFGAPAALVRPQIVSGTHAIALGLFACLRPGDELLAVGGPPYDTLRRVIAGAPGSLADFGVSYRELPAAPDGLPDPAQVAASLGPRTRLVFMQRSRGYQDRASLPVAATGAVVAAVKAARPQVVCLVDNCYGEFTEVLEPPMVGADLTAGSLIKNPGGGLAPTGGYLLGKAELVKLGAARLTAPGIAGEVGPSLGLGRLLFQGLFLAPHVTAQALAGAVFTAAFFSLLGLDVDPPASAPRSDLVQAVRLPSAEAVVTFCRAVQAASPVDAHVRPEPWPMPGYDDLVVMAAGTFVQGSSIELSADGPIRPPYNVYFQGGLTREHAVIAALRTARALAERGLLP